MKKYLPYILVFVAIAGAMTWYYGFRVVIPQYDDLREHFLYGSIGLEEETGVPYEIWKAMPAVCGDALPGEGGWRSFGFLWEEGEELPIGISKKTVGVDRIGLNCATCHTGAYRADENGPQEIVLGAPPNSLDLQAYTRFLNDCATSEAFTPSSVLAAMDETGDLSFIERMLYRFVVIPLTKRGVADLTDEFAWFDSRPDWGPGRVAVYEPVKYRIFEMEDDGIAGTVDHPSAWDQQARDGHQQHWDGNNDTYRERNVAVAVSIAIGEEIDLDAIDRVSDLMWTLPVPEYPLPIDSGLAEQGRAVYDEGCGYCHAPDGSQVGRVVPLDSLGTDPGRLDSFSEALVERIADLTRDDTEYVEYYRPFRKTNGYVNMLLDGIWLQAPYLHNGSVPTLWDLLQAPDERPTVFYRGSDVLDGEKVGFINNGPEADRFSFRYDTTLRGNGSGGHLYGTELSETDKWALIEYLKTL